MTTISQLLNTISDSSILYSDDDIIVYRKDLNAKDLQIRFQNTFLNLTFKNLFDRARLTYLIAKKNRVVFDLFCQRGLAFVNACKFGNTEFLQYFLEDPKINISEYAYDMFYNACVFGHLKTCVYLQNLFSKHKVSIVVSTKDHEIFKKVCNNNLIEIANWLCQSYSSYKVDDIKDDKIMSFIVDNKKYVIIQEIVPEKMERKLSTTSFRPLSPTNSPINIDLFRSYYDTVVNEIKTYKKTEMMRLRNDYDRVIDELNHHIRSERELIGDILEDTDLSELSFKIHVKNNHILSAILGTTIDSFKKGQRICEEACGLRLIDSLIPDTDINSKLREADENATIKVPYFEFFRNNDRQIRLCFVENIDEADMTLDSDYSDPLSLHLYSVVKKEHHCLNDDELMCRFIENEIGTRAWMDLTLSDQKECFDTVICYLDTEKRLKDTNGYNELIELKSRLSQDNIIDTIRENIPGKLFSLLMKVLDYDLDKYLFFKECDRVVKLYEHFNLLSDASDIFNSVVKKALTKIRGGGHSIIRICIDYLDIVELFFEKSNILAEISDRLKCDDSIRKEIEYYKKAFRNRIHNSMDILILKKNKNMSFFKKIFEDKKYLYNIFIKYLTLKQNLANSTIIDLCRIYGSINTEKTIEALYNILLKKRDVNEQRFQFWLSVHRYSIKPEYEFLHGHLLFNTKLKRNDSSIISDAMTLIDITSLDRYLYDLIK